MTEFVLCEHPNLPGQQVRMVNPRNGWTPVTENPSPPGEQQDDPTAGPSEPTQDEE